MRIREAHIGDAEAMSAVLIASITELCVDDHKDDPAAIAAWTANKSPETIRTWIANPDSRLYVADEDGTVLGVAGYSTAGVVMLNYVSPEARFRGVSRAMLAAMERDMLANGIGSARLESTETARRFYEGAGWRDAGNGSERFCGVSCRAMTKDLA